MKHLLALSSIVLLTACIPEPPKPNPADPVDEPSVLKQQIREFDDNADGTPDRIETYTYDANGNQLSYSRDNDGDGHA